MAITITGSAWHLWMRGLVGQPYFGFCEVDGGVPPYSISIDVLPAGLVLNPVPVDILSFDYSQGGIPDVWPVGGLFEFTGTPTAAGTVPVNITAVDSVGATGTLADTFIVDAVQFGTSTSSVQQMGLPPVTIGTPWTFQYTDDWANGVFISLFGHPGILPYQYKLFGHSGFVWNGLSVTPNGLFSGASPYFGLAYGLPGGVLPAGKIGVDYVDMLVQDATGVGGSGTNAEIAFRNGALLAPLAGLRVTLRGVKRIRKSAAPELCACPEIAHVRRAV